MKGYGQFCPIAKASEILGRPWTHLVIRELGAGSETFNDLRRGMPLISPSLLTKRLRSLEEAGIVERTETRNGVRYILTEAGRELKPVLLALGVWGQRWIRSDLDKDDLDPSLLMWDIRRTMNAGYFGRKRTILLFEFEDYTNRFRRWWLVIDRGVPDLCNKDPGHDVDLHILTDLKTLTGLWIGNYALQDCLKKKSLRFTGAEKLRTDFDTWLGRNYFSTIQAMRR